MDFAWFTYTIALIAISVTACAVNATMFVLAGRRDCLAAAAGFFLYALDTGVILFDEYVRDKPVAMEYLDAGLTHPVFQVVVGFLLVASVWAWCLLRVGSRPKGWAPWAAAAAYLVLSALLAPVGESSGPARMMAYWGMRDLAVIAALCWLGAGGGRSHSSSPLHGGVPERRWYLVALVLSALVLVEDLFNIMVFRPDLAEGWVRDLLWHLTERNLSENLLVVVCAVASVFSARHAVRVFSRHPTQDRDRLEEQDLRPEFETRLLSFSDKHGLSGREREVLELVLKGEDNQGIANALVISMGTVKAHLSRIYHKVGVPSRDKLVESFWRG